MNGLKINFFLLILIIIPMQFIAAGDKGDESSFKIGFIERLRVVAWDDAIDLDEVIDNKFLFTRHRTSVSFDWKPLNELQIFCKLTNEFRVYFQPEDREFALHEMFFDQLFVRWKRPADLPITFTIGRQNMRFGEGFLVMDGHPLDGSRSILNPITPLPSFIHINLLLTIYFQLLTNSHRVLWNSRRRESVYISKVRLVI
jgi:hypothetical protein